MFYVILYVRTYIAYLINSCVFFYLNNNLSKLKQRPESTICGCETEMTPVERFSDIDEV